MRELRSYSGLSIILTVFIIFLSGCAIGIRQNYQEMNSESEYYSDNTTYDSDYYYSSPRAGTYQYYDPTYDPWTMGTYYQYYSGPPRAYGGSEDSSSQVDNKRPASRGRESVSANQSQAPDNDRAGSRRDRASIRDRSNITPDSSSSAIASQKVRRESSRTNQPAEKDKAKHRRSQARTTTSKEDNSSQDEEDEDTPDE